MSLRGNGAVVKYFENPVDKPLALIIDDEADICYLLKDILQKKFISNSVATLGEAKRYLQTNKPYIIFLDNMLSDGLGIDHIHSIKEKYPAIKIVMITACDSISILMAGYFSFIEWI